MAALTKLRYEVIYATSEDPDHPYSELNNISPTTKGWQSIRNCSYPQEIILEFLEGETTVSQIQILSHQAKISSKIEIYIGTGSNHRTASFKRLGYLSLDSNERSSYQARELKTVFVKNTGRFMKFVLNENHPNKMNLYNQVGVVAISLLGPEDLDAKPSSTFPSNPNEYKNNYYNDVTVDINFDPNTANKLRQLADAKSRAISNEDYMAAKEIKNIEQELKSMGARLAQLNMAKSEAVASEDYDLAKNIKDQCDTLKLEIDNKIRTLKIPGVKLLDSPLPVKQVPKFAPSKQDDYPDNNDDINMLSSRYDEPSSGKKAVKVEAYNPSYGQSSGGYEEYEDNTNLLSEDRPIKPKVSLDYNDSDPTVDGGGGNAPNLPLEKFPAGDHPLEGVKNFLELPTPEQLTTLSKEYCDVNGVMRLVGEYRARCLFSKTLGLREAVFIKITDLAKKEFLQDVGGTIQGLCAICKIGVDDKIHQILFSAISLMELVLKASKNERLPKATILPYFDPIVNILVDRIADSNPRVREGARKGLDLLASYPMVGPGAVASHVVKPLTAKQKTGWRPIALRLQFLTDIVTAYGLGNASGLNLESILQFPKAAGAYAHSQGEVRVAAKELIVALQKLVGTPPLEPTLDLLRKNQKMEYIAAFENGGEAKSEVKEKPKGFNDGSKGSPLSSPTHHATHFPGGKVPTTANKAQDHGYKQAHSPRDQSNGSGNGNQEFTTCMFCGFNNPKWNENDLDLHYWKDCPLLISCPSCTQIVEIAGLPEHLIDECDAKGNYVPCEVTGLAIRKSEFEDWQNSPKCVPAPANSLYCPLCYTTVEDSDQAWFAHLTTSCPKNTRIQS